MRSRNALLLGDDASTREVLVVVVGAVTGMLVGVGIIRCDDVLAAEGVMASLEL